MKWLLTGRQMGKTTELVTWVKAGQRRNEFPGWTRVIVVPTVQEVGHLLEVHNLDGGQVFAARSWMAARGQGSLWDWPEVALDNADQILELLLGPVARATVTSGETRGAGR